MDLTAAAPSPVTVSPGLGSPRLAQFVLELEALSDAAPEWTELPALAQRLLEMVRAHQERLEARQRTRDHLRRVLTDHRVVLEFMGIGTPEDLGGDFETSADVDELESVIGALEEQLAAFSAARSKVPASFGEQETQVAVLRQIKSEIEALFRKIPPQMPENAPPSAPFPVPEGSGAADAFPVACPTPRESAPSNEDDASGKDSVTTESVTAEPQPTVEAVGGDQPGPAGADASRRSGGTSGTSVNFPAGAAGAEGRVPVTTAKAVGDQGQPPRDPVAEVGVCVAEAAIAQVPSQRGDRSRSVADLTDEELSRAIGEQLHNKEVIGALVAEQQLRWLMAGSNLRASIAAAFLDERADTGLHAEGRPVVPGWLCWFAVLMGDSSGSRVDFDVAEFSVHAINLRHQPAGLQRFFTAWLGVGLLGESAPRAVHVAQAFSGEIFEAPWVDGSPLYGFTLHRVIEPARRGQIVSLSPDRLSAASLATRVACELDAAAGVVGLAVNYRNRYVIRFWRRLVGPDGPLDSLLRRARAGTLPPRLPTSEQLAARADGWNEIQSAYRSNILQRVSGFLEHLRAAVALQQQLAASTSEPTLIPREEIDDAVRAGDQVITRLRRERCASVAGWARLRRRLETTRRPGTSR